MRGRLWRASNPRLNPQARQRLVDRLMKARRQVGAALRAQDAEEERRARAEVDSCKRALGERGPVWWKDGAPDFNRRLVRNTPYADWYAAIGAGELTNNPIESTQSSRSATAGPATRSWGTRPR